MNKVIHKFINGGDDDFEYFNMLLIYGFYRAINNSIVDCICCIIYDYYSYSSVKLDLYQKTYSYDTCEYLQCSYPTKNHEQSASCKYQNNLFNIRNKYIGNCMVISYPSLVSQNYPISFENNHLQNTYGIPNSKSLWKLRNRVCFDRYVGFAVAIIRSGLHQNYDALTLINGKCGLDAIEVPYCKISLTSLQDILQFCRLKESDIYKEQAFLNHEVMASHLDSIF